jgi:arylsulfatase
MYDNTNFPWVDSMGSDSPDENVQKTAEVLMDLNRDPRLPIYQQRWDSPLSASRNQALDAQGRPRAALVGAVRNPDARWRRLNNYYLNCLADSDRQVVALLGELKAINLTDDTIIVYTADHGELASGSCDIPNADVGFVT